MPDAYQYILAVEAEERRRSWLFVGFFVVLLSLFFYGLLTSGQAWKDSVVVQVCQGGVFLEYRPSDKTYWLNRTHRVEGPEVCGGLKND